LPKFLSDEHEKQERFLGRRQRSRPQTAAADGGLGMTNLVESAWSRKKQRGHRYALIVCLILMVCISTLAQSGQTYKVRLSTVPVDATMLARVTGAGSAKAMLKGNMLMLSGTFQGLRSAAMRASLHAGPQKGIRGPAVHDLTVSKEKAGTVSGSVELSASEVEALKNGRLYVQIDSEGAPDGNLWGWVLR
jgi:hypothetical protein